MPKAATRTATAPITTGAMQGDTPIHRAVPASSVFDLGTKKPRGRGGHRRMLADLDISQLQVRNDLPLPSTTRGRTMKGATRWDSLFDLLRYDGDSVTGIPRAYKAALCKASVLYVRQRPLVAAELRAGGWIVRVMPDGMNPRPDGRWDNPA